MGGKIKARQTRMPKHNFVERRNVVDRQERMEHDGGCRPNNRKLREQYDRSVEEAQEESE